MLTNWLTFIIRIVHVLLKNKANFPIRGEAWGDLWTQGLRNQRSRVGPSAHIWGYLKAAQGCPSSSMLMCAWFIKVLSLSIKSLCEGEAAKQRGECPVPAFMRKLQVWSIPPFIDLFLFQHMSCRNALTLSLLPTVLYEELVTTLASPSLLSACLGTSWSVTPSWHVSMEPTGTGITHCPGVKVWLWDHPLAKELRAKPKIKDFTQECTHFFGEHRNCTLLLLCP